MKSIEIIEFPSNLGLKQLSATREPGVYRLPDWLRENEFYNCLGVEDITHLPRHPYTMDLDEETKVRNGQKIATYAQQQASLLGPKVKKQAKFILAIGGDCSILIGIALALKEKGNFGLFFLDGHTDFLWPQFSGTGGAAGMDLGIVTGYGHENLTNIKNLKPYFEENNVWCVGNRHDDPVYEKLIEDSEIKYVNLNALRKISPEECSGKFLEYIEKERLDGFWIHFDVDVLNHNIMPCVDSPQEDGLNYNELSQILVPLLNSKKVVGMNITILDPDLDPGAKFTKMFVKNMVEILKTPSI